MYHSLVLEQALLVCGDVIGAEVALLDLQLISVEEQLAHDILNRLRLHTMVLLTFQCCTDFYPVHICCVIIISTTLQWLKYYH